MTLESFIVACGKSKYTVLSWLNKQLIPGAYIVEETGEWYIPDDARPPYMKRKPANGGVAMYKSLATAVCDGCAIFPELYNLTKQRFEVYVDQLIGAGIITSYVAENITYYEPTLETSRFIKMSGKAAVELITQCIEAGSKGMSQGITEAMLSKAGV